MGALVPRKDRVAGASFDCRVRLRSSVSDDLELPLGRTLVGRGSRCNIVLDDPLISRKHAIFTVGHEGVLLEDLGSTNGVRVNGSRLEGECCLEAGDKVTLGRFEGVVCLVRSAASGPKGARSMADTLIDPRDVTRALAANPLRESTLRPVAELAAKALEMRQASAGQILERPLKELMQRVVDGVAVDPEEIDIAGQLAVRLASVLGDATWIDYTFRLFHKVGHLPSASVVDLLYRCVRDVSGVDLPMYRRYVRSLDRDDQEKLGPGARFLVRRLEGLHSLL